MINTKAHALVDYILGTVILCSPWLFGFSGERVPVIVSVLYAAFIILNALLARFEFAPFRLIPLKVHYRLDFIAGAFFSTSPLIFSYIAEVFKPQLVFGLTHMAVAVLSDRVLYDTYKESSKR